MEKTFVYNNTEVILTGRVAQRQMSRKLSTLHEIRPADSQNGSWKKWVKLTDLHEIIQQTETTKK